MSLVPKMHSASLWNVGFHPFRLTLSAFIRRSHHLSRPSVMLCMDTESHWMFIRPCIIVIVEELKTNLMSLVVFISLIFAQHVSNINMFIFRSLRLWWWLTTSVILFSFRCVLGFAAGDAWWNPFCRLKHWSTSASTCKTDSSTESHYLPVFCSFKTATTNNYNQSSFSSMTFFITSLLQSCFYCTTMCFFTYERRQFVPLDTDT